MLLKKAWIHLRSPILLAYCLQNSQRPLRMNYKTISKHHSPTYIKYFINLCGFLELYIQIWYQYIYILYPLRIQKVWPITYFNHSRPNWTHNFLPKILKCWGFGLPFLPKADPLTKSWWRPDWLKDCYICESMIGFLLLVCVSSFLFHHFFNMSLACW